MENAKPGAAKPAASPAAAPAAARPRAASRAKAPARLPKRSLQMYADRETEEVKLDGMRRTIAARLTEAKQTIPHFYLRRDVRLDALMAFRAQLNKRWKAAGVKLSVNDFVIKACALALSRCRTPTPSGRATGSSS